jgi:hypothetical protein
MALDQIAVLESLNLDQRSQSAGGTARGHSRCLTARAVEEAKKRETDARVLQSTLGRRFTTVQSLQALKVSKGNFNSAAK